MLAMAVVMFNREVSAISGLGWWQSGWANQLWLKPARPHLSPLEPHHIICDGVMSLTLARSTLSNWAH